MTDVTTFYYTINEMRTLVKRSCTIIKAFLRSSEDDNLQRYTHVIVNRSS